MIQELSRKYQQVSAATLLALCLNGMILPFHLYAGARKAMVNNFSMPGKTHVNATVKNSGQALKYPAELAIANTGNKAKLHTPAPEVHLGNTPTIAGPSQPEMSAFKPVGTDNMVNLFTGDFSYNIPLLDVGGYPVNIFYDGGVGMEQEASWVGLGWNINPGNVNRNMRGMPDDFDGSEKIVQTQMMKPNINWGVTLGSDVELVGIKQWNKIFSGSAGASLGIGFNNYLGPSLDVGIKGSTQVSLTGKGSSEKAAPVLGGSLNINASSRSGVTFSPSLSLTARAAASDNGATRGLGLKASTSFNSRVGVKSIQIAEQMSLNYQQLKKPIIRDIFSTSITFNKPSYIPTMRMPMTNSAYSGHFQVGSGIFGGAYDGEVEVYKQKSEIAAADRKQIKSMVGYLYLQNAAYDKNAVMDFTRVNDNEVTPSTPIISAPQYTYDVFSVQGEGTGGTIRAYRNDEGYVRDNLVESKDKSFGAGGDIDAPGHYGGNLNIVHTPSSIDEWGYGNKLRAATGFTKASGGFENVYFRNPGENSVINPNQYNRIGGTSLVRYKLGGYPTSPTIEPVLEQFTKANTISGTVNLATTAKVTERKKRSQVISFLRADEAASIGLDKDIKSYDRLNVLNAQNILNYTTIPRVDGTIRRANHISQINITEANGQRYVYGIPVYNIKQKDFTFSVNNAAHPSIPDKVNFNADDATTNSAYLSKTSQKDGYLQITETPAYAHSFLLSGLLSPDYLDVTNDGITDDDLGTAVKFNYTRIDGISKWRTPLTPNYDANFNAGKRTETKDDKGFVSYGERESWYMHSIESKTMIALFTLENRQDSKGSLTEYNDINRSDNTAQRLKQIDLYSKADLKRNGLAGAKPIKTVHFQYSYNLCANTPNNGGATETDPVTGANVNAAKGKLTLERIWFTFNGQNKSSKSQYVFSYGTAPADNPDYAFNASDRWGVYKPSSANPQGQKNADYPYSIQDKAQKSTIDQNASAWMLKKVLLPSGGQIEVNYESDDYAYVQNKRAATMMQVVGFGSAANAYSTKLYDIIGSVHVQNNYVFIKVPEACANGQDVFQKYLKGNDQFAFKLAVSMPKGIEYIHAYATMDGNNYGLYPGDATNTTIWMKLNLVDGKSPLFLTAVEFLREQLPGQAYPGYDVLDETGLKQVGDMLTGWWDGIKSSFRNPVDYLMYQGKAQWVDVTQSSIRLNDPDGFKYGGGYRVKSVRLKDNWKAMNSGQLYTSEYGQEYDYTTTEVFNGVERTISSGVASYEPSLGGEENPFQTMLQVSNKLPLGPASYSAIEMPVMDAFFPTACVGYSKVTVRTIKKGIQDPTKKSRSGIGRQVTEFYTAKDFPVYSNYTPLDATSDLQASSSSFSIFWYKYAFDSRAISQGFIVELNDMHGKMKTQASYPENDDKTAINFTQNFYRNTGSNGWDEKFDFVYANQGGAISQGNMGVDVELMTDTREFAVRGNSFEVQAQVDCFPVLGAPVWLPFIWPVVGNSDNVYRAVTATKIVTYHSILDKVLVIDKGSQVSTQNMLFDAETGDVLVNRTNNEFNKPVYTVKYPAWWAYSGMGLAYKNIDAVYSTVNFLDGAINLNNANDIFESGDELYVTNIPSGTPGCNPESGNVARLWAFDKNKNNTALTVPVKDLIFLDSTGKPYTKSGVNFRIVRSGKRNQLDAVVSSFTLMSSPVVNNKLTINSAGNVVAAGAVEYKEKWQTDNDIFRKYLPVFDNTTCSFNLQENCTGDYEKSINPYVKGLIGNFRSNRSLVYYGDRVEKSVTQTPTTIDKNGYLDNSFSPYWNFNAQNNLVPDVSNTKWVWNSESNKYNSKGLELETKDALNIYTAAQYGYNKNTPVAIAHNSRINEMFGENFEDYGYAESIDVTASNMCAQRQIDFSNSPYGSIVNADVLGQKAHSGNYMLQVNANSTLSKSIAVSSIVPDDYDLTFTKDITKNLYQTGGNILSTQVQPFVPTDNNPNYTTPQALWEGITSFANGGFNVPGVIIRDAYSDNNNSRSHYFNVVNSYYIEVLQSGNYNFILNYNKNETCNLTALSLQVALERIDGAPGLYLTLTNSPAITYSNVFVCKGIYKVTSTIKNTLGLSLISSPALTYPWYPFWPNQSGSAPCYYYQKYSWGWYCPTGFPDGNNNSWGYPGISFTTNAASINYKSLATQNGCSYTNPLATSINMINNIFSPTGGKKMLFSAWVKEGCGQGNHCSSVNIVFSDNSSIAAPLTATGPVIEGWQKVEGEFTIPQGVSTMFLNLGNSSPNLPVYFDDIRIHPYNANMKTFVYDPVNLRMVAQLDENNYASYFEYDDEGTLIRTKAETKEGIKTITETRSAKQTVINTLQ